MKAFSHSSLNAVRNAVIRSNISSETVKYIGTHHGTFHCDEALAVSLLKILPEYKNHEIVRTRDQTILDQCDVVVDVGGEYNVEKKRFDHHQKSFGTSFEGSLEENAIKLSSAGLVYKHFGRPILRQICAEHALDDSTVELIYKKVYKGFVEHIDAIDNGVEMAENGTKLRYTIPTSLSSRVGNLNPNWNEPQTDDVVNDRFHAAMTLTSSEFVDSVLYLVEGWLPAREIFANALKSRFDVHESGAIVKLSPYCPWKSHLRDLEKEGKVVTDGEIKFILYEDAKGSMWRVQGVNTEEGSFQLRRALPTAWRGLRGEELVKKSRMEGISFVHAAGFIGGHSTYEGAVQMAATALTEN